MTITTLDFVFALNQTNSWYTLNNAISYELCKTLQINDSNNPVLATKFHRTWMVKLR